jgi:hypothetical protein
LLRLLTITTLPGPEPVPFSVMYGLFDGMLTISRYVPGLMLMVTRRALLVGTALTAACTVGYWPEPTAATVNVVPGLVVGVEPAPAYVSNSAIRGALDALVMSRVSFFSDVEVKEMVLGLPLPLVRTAPVSALSSRQAPIDPPPGACTMTAEDTVVALVHLTET